MKIRNQAGTIENRNSGPAYAYKMLLFEPHKNFDTAN